MQSYEEMIIFISATQCCLFPGYLFYVTGYHFHIQGMQVADSSEDTHVKLTNWVCV